MTEYRSWAYFLAGACEAKGFLAENANIEEVAEVTALFLEKFKASLGVDKVSDNPSKFTVKPHDIDSTIMRAVAEGPPE